MVNAAYILSAGRSGSTLLNLLLGSHQDAIAVGELTHLPKNLALNSDCACGVPVTDCPFWKAVTEAMSFRLGKDLKQDPYSLELGYIGASRMVDERRLTRRYRLGWKLRHGWMYFWWLTGMSHPPVAPRSFDASVANTLSLYSTVRSLSGKQMIVDSSKNYIKGVAVYRAAPSTTRMVLLTRDGRASYYSRLRSGFDRERSLRAWKNYYANALPLITQQVDEEHLLRVRYEDLATDPETELQRICSFLNLQFDPGMLDFRNTTHHIANGNDMRFSDTRVIRLDRAWEYQLGRAERSYFDTQAGRLNRWLGYI